MLLPFPGGIRLPPHLQIPPEVLTHWPKVGDVLQRGFELQRDFLRRGRARLNAQPRVRSRVPRPTPPRPSQLKPGGFNASSLLSPHPGRARDCRVLAAFTPPLTRLPDAPVASPLPLPPLLPGPR